MHWSTAQSNRLAQYIEQGCVIAYYNTDVQGFPCNSSAPVNGWDAQWQAKPGAIQEVNGPLELCSPHALHATKLPHRWKGSRVWVVAMHGEVQWKYDKCGALKREILGEVLPEEAWNESVGARLGRKDLTGADLREAYLYKTDLNGSNLRGANLRGADLSEANLRGANLSKANLSVAYLRRADLSVAYLRRADLSGADLSGASRPENDIAGWKANKDGCLEKM